MKIVGNVEELREQIADWRRAGDHVALVPTMGNLHQGHLSLIDIARECAERVVVSIFVNPTQFSASEDLEGYPRTLELDKRKLKRAKVDLIFAPDVETMYPFGVDSATSVRVPVLTEDLCGTFRPGHFDGVTTVVNRLFSLVQPDVAVFGRKDYQQQLVIRRMVQDLNIPVEIVTGPTVREDDGLAMSSRNQYLTEDERKVAPELHAELSAIAEALAAGDRDFGALEKVATDKLGAAGFRPDYVAIRRADDLGEPGADTTNFVVLAAAWLGDARLIDNIDVIA
ncbi:MAG: pantoate--beta-alanine ligase [Gammaproteobacteria bacterium]|nr:pantoate--beta-alanine ligase [Gammaproteobacteria bacterium]